jgi:hypothetical protein
MDHATWKESSLILHFLSPGPTVRQDHGQDCPTVFRQYDSFDSIPTVRQFRQFSLLSSVVPRSEVSVTVRSFTLTGLYHGVSPPAEIEE